MANVDFKFNLGDSVNVLNMGLTGKVTELSITSGNVTWAYVNWMNNEKELKGAYFPEAELSLHG